MLYYQLVINGQKPRPQKYKCSFPDLFQAC